MSLKANLFGCIAACLILTTSLHGQGVAVSSEGIKLSGFDEVDLDATIEVWAKNELHQTTTYLELQLALLKDICELTEDQADKLRLLTKGIGSRRISSGKQQLKDFMTTSELVPADETPMEPSVAADKLMVSGAKKSHDQKRVVLFRTRFEQPLFDLPLWQGVIESTLTESQFAMYQTHCLDRNAQFLETAVMNALGELDSEVCLLKSQKDSIRETILAELGPLVTISHPENMDRASKMVELTLKKRERLRPVLSAKQFARLNYLDGQRNWGGVGWNAR